MGHKAAKFDNIEFNLKPVRYNLKAKMNHFWLLQNTWQILLENYKIILTFDGTEDGKQV